MPFSLTETNDATIVEANGARAFLFPPTATNQSFTSLPTPLAALTEAGTALESTHKAEAVGPALLASNAGRDAMSAVSLAYGTALSKKRERIATMAEMMQPVAAADADTWPEWRAVWRSLDKGAMANRLRNAGLSEAAAVAMAPALAGADDDIAELARERFLALNVIERVGIAGQHPAEPSLDADLLAVGIDQDATIAAGEAYVAAMREGEAASRQDDRTLKELVQYLAAAFAITPADALARVLP